MIKKFLLILIIFIFSLSATAKECEIICPSESTYIIENEKLYNKITGLNFVSKQIAETIIEKELKEELNSKVKTKLDIFSIKRLKKGEFKALTLNGKKIQYKSLSLSNFYAETICPYNKIYYKKGRIYYPKDLPLKYKATITNEDIKNVIESSEFQNELKRTAVKFNNNTAIHFESPDVKIKDNKLLFSIPLQTFLGKLKISFASDIEVKNNTIMLKNITFNKKSNIINYDILSPFINNINPIKYEINTFKSKYCKIYITKAKISDNIIETEGIFIINKNYGNNE